MKKQIISVLFGFLFLFLYRDVFADVRRYVWTYEYQTVPKGMSELEYYETIKVPDTNETSIKTLEHWLEFEYGLTEHSDVAIYQKWKTKDKREEINTKYDGTKLRFRYRFGEKGQFVLDPLVYFEYKRSAEQNDPHELELKFILAKDIGRLNIAYNQILNQVLEKDGVSESEYAAGLSYRLNNHVAIGLESKGSYLKDKYYFGPSISVRGKRFWAAFGFASAIHKRADDIQMRVIIGIPF